MTRRILLIVVAIAFLFTGMSLIASTEKQTGTICTLTNEKVEGCCCEKQDNGKLYCTKAKKDIDDCCCKAAEK